MNEVKNSVALLMTTKNSDDEEEKKTYLSTPVNCYCYLFCDYHYLLT